MIYLTNLNLNGNELQNAVIQPLATAPANPKLGQIYCDSKDSRIKWYDGTAWKVVGVVVESSEANGNIKVDGVDMKVYELPAATADTLGGIKVGAGLTVDAEGKLSVTEITRVAEAGKADDADKLGGQLPDYYATAEALEELSDTVSTLTGVAADDMMKKTVYDTDNDGVVDKAADADKLGGQAPDYYATAQSVTDLGTEVAKKVDAVEGKGLSEKDFTADYETKLKGISVGAEVNVQADWDVEDATSDAYILNKPTALSQFTNDEEFIDKTVSDLVNYYTKTETLSKEEINTLIAGIATISIVVPESGELPASGKTNELYLIPKVGGANPNAYDEYLWTGSAFEKIGDTEIDLSNYLTKTGDASNTTVAFLPAGERALPATGDTVAVIMSKVAKYLTDLSAVAFSGSYNDLSDTPTHVKYANYNMSSVDGTQKVITVEGSSVIAVTLTDAVTHEVLVADTTINGLTVTVKTSEVYANGINVLVAYI